MIHRLRQWLDTLGGSGQRDRVDACVECGGVSPPGANRCGECLGSMSAD